MKNIVVGVITLVVVGLMIFTAMDDAVFQGGHQAKGIGAFKEDKAQNFAVVEEKSDREKEDEELKALRDKAGSISAFKVSNEYKSKCASCHGVNGSGFQNGKAMMGPPVFGQSEEEVYASLVEFKSGRKENTVMKGLLMNLEDEDLRRFAKEIGEFPARAKAEQN